MSNKLFAVSGLDFPVHVLHISSIAAKRETTLLIQTDIIVYG